MQINPLNLTVFGPTAIAAITSGFLLAKQPPALKTQAKSADSAAMAQAEAEAELARLRELIRPQPGEYATNIARIAWERDPWEAAVKAGRDGKPVIAYGLHNAGVTCGFG